MSNEFVMVPRELAEEINAALELHGYVSLPRALQVAMAKPAMRQGEPVAWQVTGPSGVMGCYVQRPYEWAHGYKIEPLYAHADPGEVERLRSSVAELRKSLREQNRVEFQNGKLRAHLAERDAHPMRALSQEAYSTLVGMVEFCLNQRVCMGMDEGFKSFDPEEEHDFVKELRSFVALSASAETSAPKCGNCGSGTGQACNDKACGYLEDGNGAPVERDERAEFEALVLRDWPKAPLERNLAGDFYYNDAIQRAWYGWQARAALERKP